LTDKHPLRTGILCTVIGGLILTLILRLTGFFPAVWQSCKLAFRFLISSVSLPVWLIVLISILIVPTLIRIFAFFKKNPNFLDYTDYTQDEILGMRWRWHYNIYGGGIANISCFCPSDDTELIYEDWGSKVVFRCETCGKRFGPFEGNRNYVIGKAERQIHRKLRSGDWKVVVEN
jgi:hypothetical protein